MNSWRKCKPQRSWRLYQTTDSMADLICCWHLSCSTWEIALDVLQTPTNLSNAMILWFYLPVVLGIWTLGPCWSQGTWEHNSWIVFKQVLLAALQTSHWILVNIQGKQRNEERGKRVTEQEDTKIKPLPCVFTSLNHGMKSKQNLEEEFKAADTLSHCILDYSSKWAVLVTAWHFYD